MLSYCAGCGANYEWDDWPKHRMCATNKVETATNRISDATNGVSDSGLAREDSGRTETGSVARTANRRSRAAYNAYQREYMRKIRAAV